MESFLVLVSTSRNMGVTFGQVLALRTIQKCFAYHDIV